MKISIAAVCFLLFTIIGLATYSICSASYVESDQTLPLTQPEPDNVNKGTLFYKIGQEKSPLG